MSSFFGLPSRVALVLPFTMLLGVATTGCGALGALGNPKAAFAASESAPMSVVVRRAEVARATAESVDRLLTKTGVDDASTWTEKTAMPKEDAEARLHAAGGEPVYGGAKLRVMAAEAWADNLGSVCSSEKKHASLILALSPKLGDRFDELSEAEDAVIELKAKVAKEDQEASAKGVSDADKETHNKAKADAQKELDKANEELEPKLKAVLAALKTEAEKASPEVKERLSTPLLNLKRAVADARTANAAALIRYPMAVTGLIDDLQATAKRVAADVIEEKSGSRPDLSGLKPEVKLEGIDVKLTLNGIPADKLGSLTPDEIVSETTKRLSQYAKRVMSLPVYVGETEEKLSFEAKLLEAWSDGMKVTPNAKSGVEVGDLSIESGPAKADAKKVAVAGPRSPVGVAARSCNAPAAAAPEKEAKAAPPAKPGKGAKGTKPDAVATKPINVPARFTPTGASQKSDAPAAPPTKSTGKKGGCDVSVESADGRICL